MTVHELATILRDFPPDLEVRIYYEDARFGFSNVRLFDDGVYQSAGIIVIDVTDAYGSERR